MFIKGTLPEKGEDQWKLAQAIDKRVERWAYASLSFSGCKCCSGNGEESEDDDFESRISVWVRLFEKKTG